MFNAGDVVVATVKLGDGGRESTRAAVVLFEEYDSVVVAGMTSSTFARGIPVTRREGAPRDGVIRLNYIFTVPRDSLSRPLFRLGREKRKVVLNELIKRLSGLE
jgi:mRNA interferase MazF